ncbi:proteasome maturation factor UMP1-domain-containing protein [Aspergillus pseudonomiae]|uniref:Proteasome maturation factor UMP1-domain-containing protein n=2 Tax=Aspergillus subgen. Circumdati TaxID=2720871 RepID=A0A5N7DAG8_9EURO|nr:proteasome maturation factor UMP1-domain-containing protein [Aspergillus pseudonomiae]KAB8258787.1 proteasome maturation factor UMP1-domain-containing protein [Aspergillus pseudonomiae]KAE8403381.1 proteasome maturation factor UMP1-domain-containing protein [Aspergillus pseudonomiae]
MSLRIAPATNHRSQTTNTTTRQNIPISLPHPSKGAPSAPGLPDTLRDNITLPASRGPPSSQSEIPASAHPLEARLIAWRQTQDAMKMESLRRAYGIAEPIRRGMELKLVRDGTFRPAVLGGAKAGNVHEDILVLGGRDTEVGWEDVFKGDEFREPPTFHDEMEKRLRMDF